MAAPLKAWVWNDPEIARNIWRTLIQVKHLAALTNSRHRRIVNGMLETLATELAHHGLMLRGGFHPGGDDTIPDQVQTVLMVGNAGPDMWRAVSHNKPNDPNPLDAWTKSVLDPIAAHYDATATYPFDGPPYHPFQKWAQVADDVHPSPIGPLIHPTFGLWHAYRGAFLFEIRMKLPDIARTASPCASCSEKPCLATCPVEALSDGHYDVPACRDHMKDTTGSDCLELGCRARRACPIGQDFIYDPSQAEFHMQSFLTA